MKKKGKKKYNPNRKSQEVLSLVMDNIWFVGSTVHDAIDVHCEASTLVNYPKHMMDSVFNYALQKLNATSQYWSLAAVACNTDGDRNWTDYKFVSNRIPISANGAKADSDLTYLKRAVTANANGKYLTSVFFFMIPDPKIDMATMRENFVGYCKTKRAFDPEYCGQIFRLSMLQDRPDIVDYLQSTGKWANLGDAITAYYHKLEQEHLSDIPTSAIEQVPVNC